MGRIPWMLLTAILEAGHSLPPVKFPSGRLSAISASPVRFVAGECCVITAASYRVNAVGV